MDVFSDLTLFAQIAKLGSMAAAAQELGVTPPVVSRRLAALEARLGTRLLNRTTRRLSLTPDGELYLNDGARILEQLTALEHRLGGGLQPQGTIRIGATLARGALIAPDATSIRYVLEKCPDIVGATRQAALAAWTDLRSDDGAGFDQEYRFDATAIEPHVTWGTSPDQVLPISGKIPFPQSLGNELRRSAEQALRYTGLQPGAALAGTPIEHVFIGSCTNARIEDLRAAAAVVAGRQVAPGVRAMVVPGSGAVKQQAEAEGLDKVFANAGFEWRKPGCSMCLAMNDDVLMDGIRCASTTNRNFEGRQGRGAITHLMSPAMAAAAAVTGVITDVRKMEPVHV